MTCEHVNIERTESISHRLPLVIWNCYACGIEFRAVLAWKIRLLQWLEVKLLRRDLKEWKNG